MPAARRNPAEPGPDRFDGKPQGHDRGRAGHERHDGPRDRRNGAAQHDDRGERHDTEDRGRRIDGVEMPRERLEARKEFAWHLSMRSPRKSRICVLAIRTAMPLVKPMTTGRGMNLTAAPMPVTPSMTSITPAIIVHMNRPSTPYFATMPATTTTKAPVGPPIWTRDPPSAEIMKPVTIAQ